MSLSSVRLPFAPRVSAAGVCTLAVAAAGLVSAPAITAYLHSIGLRHVAVTDVAPSAVLAATALALLGARAAQAEVAAVRWVAGGVVAGVLGSAGTCLTVSGRLDRWMGTFTDLTLGALVGLLFGIVCLFPGLEAVKARRDGAHSSRDVQIVNTSAWLCAFSAIAAMTLPAEPWSTVTVMVAVSATILGVFGWVRWSLRRRWLRRVFAGRDPVWAVELVDSGHQTLPALDLLSSWADERALVRIAAAAGSAYRSADRRIATGRVVPSLR